MKIRKINIGVAMPGDTIMECIKECIDFCILYNDRVTLHFNTVELFITGHSLPGDIYQEYREKLMKSQEAIRHANNQ